MGFGIKTDLATGRKLNLDKSYEALIKPVVESRNIRCLRADEIRHSGSINLQMFQQLLSADIVIGDISTANVNAFYELGLRHALKPRTTIIIAESQYGYPFDLNGINISSYTHLGENIDYFEVIRFQKLLGEMIDQIMSDTRPDSPVYTLITDLIPPMLNDQAINLVGRIGDVLTARTQEMEAEQDPDVQTLSLKIKQAEAYLKNKQFEEAKTAFANALQMLKQEDNPRLIANNTYLVQRLALTTYQAKKPDEASALKDALSLLKQIGLDHTNDTETVALAGAIEKHLYELGDGIEHLENAILFYQRGYYLLHNRYHGINLAYLLHLRSTTELDSANDEKIADLVWANRIRREVIAFCAADDAKIAEMESQVKNSTGAVSEEQVRLINEQKFWINVNRAEAHFGLGQNEEFENAIAKAILTPHEDWMMNSFTDQLEQLKKLMDKK